MESRSKPPPGVLSFQVRANRMENRHFKRMSKTMLPVLGPLVALCVLAGAAQPPELETSVAPVDLVRRAVAKELQNEKSVRYFMWLDRVQKPRGSQTKQMIQTPDGIIARLVAINDKPLTREQRKQDDDRINRLLDPDKMREKTKRQRDDGQHVERLLRALPDAFTYEYADAETGGNGNNSVKLNFAPNSNFTPPNRESQVFGGMKGQIWINSKAMRIARIEGTLFRDVDFGWGVLGRLNKGGRFVVEQADIGNGHWDATRMELTFNGKVLMFKSLHIEQTETDWDFHPVPRLDVQKALEMLRRSGDQFATPPQVDAKAEQDP